MSAPILTPGEVTGQLVERIAALESDLAHAVASYHREKEDRRELQRACDNLKLALDAETNKCVNLRRAARNIVAHDGDLITQDKWFALRAQIQTALRDGRAEP